ncbi:uncharacterized protein LOC104883579 [Beta vulgaris subsp. vulgaris]|uniref:uncharacterized protein LOC104883579 n=1 Tax=Beta vulgaris subsp. vulgaris TaxID=3555 RepID=UPI00053FBF61|nr:uncharacterized protein LOC104883579 [Beta vulgaris subsp. vulgaris]
MPENTQPTLRSTGGDGIRRKKNVPVIVDEESGDLEGDDSTDGTYCEPGEGETDDDDDLWMSEFVVEDEIEVEEDEIEVEDCCLYKTFEDCLDGSTTLNRVYQNGSWRIHASVIADNIIWAIKTLKGNHKACGRLEENPMMADRSVKYPLGILKDVPVRVGKFYIHVDFGVLDMEEDSQIPIILGRPFLCTSGVVIDVKSSSLSLSVGDDTVTFKLTNDIQSPMLEHTCCRIDVLDENSGVSFQQFLSNDLLETIFNLNDGLDIDKVADCKVMESICSTFEPQVKKLELKPLPSHIKYAYLDDDEECPMIVDRAKIKAIEKVPPPVNVKGVRSFLGHAGFYCKFIKDFSKIVKPLTQLLVKDATFDITDACVESFERIKEALITSPIIQPLDWSLLFLTLVE